MVVQFWAWVRVMEVLEKVASPMSVILGEDKNGVMNIAGEVKMEKKRRRTQERLMEDNPIYERFYRDFLEESWRRGFKKVGILILSLLLQYLDFLLGISEQNEW